MTTIGPASARQEGCCCRTFCTKPKASLLVPASDPSALTMTQLMAPMRRATASTSSTIVSARCLCGIVMLQPEKPSGARPAGSSRRAGAIASGTSVRPARAREQVMLEAASAMHDLPTMPPASKNDRGATVSLLGQSQRAKVKGQRSKVKAKADLPLHG